MRLQQRLNFLLTVAAAFALLATQSLAATIYDADFSGSQGITHTTSSPPPAGPHSVAGPNWTFSYQATPGTDTSANFARAAGDRFETEDWGGGAQVISSAIDVSSYDAVDIEWDGTTVGSAVFNNTPTEFFRWFYTLDGGSPVAQQTTTDGSLDKLLLGVDVSSALSLQVGFSWNVDGAGDGFDMFGMTVSGEPASPQVPEPGSIALMLLGSVALLGVRRFGR